MDLPMDVWFILSPNVNRAPSEYTDQPAIFRHFVFSDGEGGRGSSLRYGANQVNSRVNFFRQWGYNDRGERKNIRMLEFYGERDGWNPTLPSLVVCAAGRNTWCGSNVRNELGKPGFRYGSICVLKPGVKPVTMSCEPILSPNGEYWPPSRIGGIILGSWLHRLPVEGEPPPLLQVVTAPFWSLDTLPPWDTEGYENEEEYEAEEAATDEACLLT